jgi:hypothetical protein
MIFVVSLFLNVFSLGANKEDLLHVTHHIISSLLFGWNPSFSRLFQHFMSLTYENEMSFLCLGMNIFFFLHYDLHLLKVLNTKWCSPHYVCIMSNETIEQINGPKKERCIIFLNVFPMFLKFWLQNYFDILCFDNLITTSHHYYIVHTLWYQPIYILTKMCSMAGVFIFQKRKKNLSI